MPSNPNPTGPTNPASGKPAHPEDIQTVDDLLSHFEQLEAQLQAVREGLSHSHRLSTLGTIASVIAHEYNNILTPVISYCQLALKHPDDIEKMKKAVEKSLAGAERAASISGSLLGFAREEDDRHVASLPEVIDDAINCMGRHPEKDGIEMKIDAPRIKLAIGPLNLQQVLVNLFMNAREAMRRTGGSITVTAEQKAQLATLTVADNGPGIPQEVLDRLYEPFVTHRRDAHARQGTGLGLSICRDLVEQAGGTIDVDTAADRGTTFTIKLPIAEELFDTDQAGQTEAA